jgi:hypothetical protein
MPSLSSAGHSTHSVIIRWPFAFFATYKLLEIQHTVHSKHVIGATGGSGVALSLSLLGLWPW